MSPLSRRAMLRGAGALVALPFLEAMLPRRAFAATPPATRFVGYFVPCGIHMDAFTPAAEGADFALTPILQPLGDLRADVLVLSGLANRPAQPDGTGDHAAGTGSFLTARHCRKTEGEGIRNGISLDQLLAERFRADTRLPSLVLGAEGGGSVGGCDSGYSCAYSRNISWAGESTPVGKEVDPRGVFDRLFAGYDPTETAEQAAKRRFYRKSVLDFVRDDAERLQARLGKTDRRKMDEYLTGVRELERQVDLAARTAACAVVSPPEPPQDIQAHVRLMSDLMVLALQCEQTRVCTFMLGNGGSTRPYPFLGVPEGHHEVSHHQDDPENHRKLTLIDTWEVEQLAYLLQRLKAVQEGETTLLANTLVFWSSEIEDGNAHRHTNLPILLAGQAGGLRTGRHLRVGGEAPIANLFVSMLQLLGQPDASFGDDGTGPLGGLV